ncbi:TetR/AcrR family transcriptional regulator [Leptothrix discophora]|uniref:Helix-turn-helix domain-containing protein n=1 Tax=Leptothrix discophora TaxID=89 RepID=A0ABT9FYT0_LEPDI|nr:TetR/AcrR family transcriptional regulator [Leptothrix discophora]MDP4299383.1 helix-turn-helix domain-containing protein [Leptothrix discophora]
MAKTSRTRANTDARASAAALESDNGGTDLDAADPSGARAERQRALADVRRSLVLKAARDAFFELGLEGASLREIARRAGYTPGAIYSYFDSKEAVYGALLAESLERLNAAVAPAAAAESPTAALRTAALAFFDFYRENPRDLDLGFYLFQGMQPRGLTPELNETLNARLRDALEPTRHALIGLGWPEDGALTETTALFAHVVGLLVLSHTGRIRMFRQPSTDLFQRYLDQLLQRRPGGGHD